MWSRGGLWCLLVLLLLLLLLLEKRRSEKKRSGQAGLFVPKAATTARVEGKPEAPQAFPPFATYEEGECISPREVFLLRARAV